MPEFCIGKKFLEATKEVHCGASFIKARTQSDVVAKILKHIKFHFEVLAIPDHPPPPVQRPIGFDLDEASPANAH